MEIFSFLRKTEMFPFVQHIYEGINVNFRI